MATPIFNDTTATQPANSQAIDLQGLRDELGILDATYSLTCLDGKASFDDMDSDRQDWYMLGIARMIDNCRRMADQLHLQDIAQRRAQMAGAV